MPKIFFQDKGYSDLDKKVLKSLLPDGEVEVLEDPESWSVIDKDTLLISIQAPRQLVNALPLERLPAGIFAYGAGVKLEVARKLLGFLEKKEGKTTDQQKEQEELQRYIKIFEQYDEGVVVVNRGVEGLDFPAPYLPELNIVGRETRVFWRKDL